MLLQAAEVKLNDNYYIIKTLKNTFCGKHDTQTSGEDVSFAPCPRKDVGAPSGPLFSEWSSVFASHRDEHILAF